MKKIRVLIAEIAAVGMLASAEASAQGIPTFDGAAIAEWGMQLEAMAEQYGVSLDTLLEAREMVTQTTDIRRSLEQRLEQSLNINLEGELQNLQSQLENRLGEVAITNGIRGSTASIVEMLNTTYQGDLGDGAPSATSEAVSRTTMDTLRGAVVEASMRRDSLGGDMARVDRLWEQSQNATGALEAQMAGNQLTAELAQQVIKQRDEALAQSVAANAAAMMSIKAQARQGEISSKLMGVPVQAGGQ